MSNDANRGQEISIRVAVGSQPREGTFLRCKTFSATPRTDLVEDDYLGEAQTETDVQHHGWDLSATFDEVDASAIDFTTELARREENHERPQQVTITVITRFRDGKTKPKIEVYPDVAWKQSERSMGGRKERIANSFEGKCKTRSVLTR